MTNMEKVLSGLTKHGGQRAPEIAYFTGLTITQVEGALKELKSCDKAFSHKDIWKVSSNCSLKVLSSCLWNGDIGIEEIPECT